MAGDPWLTPFKMSCFLYMASVVATFLFGLAHLDADGASFVFTSILTAPWFFLAMYLPRAVFVVLTAFYDLPLFLISAALNIVTFKMLRGLLLAL